jgi:hypothetical protein
MPTFREVERGIDSLALQLVDDREHVGRSHHDDVGSEVRDQLHLTLDHPSRDGYDGEAELLRASVGAEPPGE